MNQTELFPSPPDHSAIGAVDLWARDLGLQPVIGVDEAGRGPLAGPVVAAAVVLPVDPLPPGLNQLNDSKKLTESTRDTLFDIIMESAIAVGVGEADSETIDRVNILEAHECPCVLRWRLRQPPCPDRLVAFWSMAIYHSQDTLEPSGLWSRAMGAVGPSLLRV